MAVLKKILVKDFRNIEMAELSFSPSINCICGENGQGKTNLLDAIHYLSMTKSAFGYSDRMCIRHGCESLSLAGEYSMPDGLTSRFVLTADKSSKTVRKDDKLCQRMGEHIGRLPVVMVSPIDYSLVSESGEERRRFVNAVLSQMDASYLASLQKYNRLLVQRNHILKEQHVDMSLLEVLDAQMAESATAIYRARENFAGLLNSAAALYCSQLSGGVESVSVRYSSDLASSDGTPADLAELLGRNRERDLFLKYTSAGPQRDDFIFEMDGYPIRKCGSQGQQKSFLVALKLAQYDIMKKSSSVAPMLLLDDVFDKLDRGRIARLLRIVSNEDRGQIFITDTVRARMESVVSEIGIDAEYFMTENGKFQTGKA